MTTSLLAYLSLLRLLNTHQDLANRLLSEPSFFLVIDSYPIELLFPYRQGRSTAQIGTKGKDKGRWSVGIKLCWLVNDYGEVVGWVFAGMHVQDGEFLALVEHYPDSIVLSDLGFRDQYGIPDNLKLCKTATWPGRMVIESVFSLLTRVCVLKKLTHRTPQYIRARLGFTAAMFNVLLSLSRGLNPNASNPAIACFSL